MTKFEGFSTNEQERIERVLSNFDSNFINEIFKKILSDHSLMDSEDKYSTFGKYDTTKGILKLNPRVFITEDFDDGERKLSKLGYIILHEVAHALDRKYKESGKKEWLELSGWVEDPIIKRGKKNLVIPHPDGEVHSQWYYDSDAKFPRWYSAYSPKEDFCDGFAFAFAGLNKKLSKEKLDYVKSIITKLKIQKVI